MIKTLLFDMGGVLFIQDTAGAFQRFSEIGLDAHKYIGDFGQKGIFLDLEEGKISAEEFRAELSRLVNRDLTWEETQHCWLGFVKSVPHERLVNLLQLRGKYRICLASNTNPYIMAYMRSDRFSGDGHGIGDYLDKQYCSYEMGCCKPKEEFFKKIIESEGLKPEEIIFIDDSKKNIAAAEAIGIKGIWIPSNEDWTPALEQYLK